MSAAKKKVNWDLAQTSPNILKVLEKCTSLRQARPEELRRGKRDSPFNRTPLSKEIRLLFAEIKKEGGLGLQELKLAIDTTDMSNPSIKQLSKEVKGVRPTLLTQLRKLAKEYELPSSIIKTRNKNLIIIAGEELV